MMEHGTMINNQLIRHKAYRDGDKPIQYTEAPQFVNGYRYSYHWEETDTAIIQVWDSIEDAEAVYEEQPTAYTAEQLSAMTNAELSVICAELGISGSMTKANMIALILDKQNNIA